MVDRPKDSVDIATMIEARSLDVPMAADRLGSVLGDDPRVGRLRGLG